MRQPLNFTNGIGFPFFHQARTAFGTGYPLLFDELSVKPLAWRGVRPHTLGKLYTLTAMTKAKREISVTRYSRPDVLRILHLKARELTAWEQAGLVAPSEQYTFQDLGQLRTLRNLRATRISLRNISRSISAMQRVAGMRNVLLESSAVRRGSRLVWRHAGMLMDPLTQQLSLDFDGGAGVPMVRAGRSDLLRNSLNVQDLFLQAVKLEEHLETIQEAADLYESILLAQPSHAAAAINLGTIRYNQQDFSGAEGLYRRATEADPEYALAFFDLGNVLDEMQRMDEAIVAYRRALALVPQYADAHYNLALAYERRGKKRRALRHWRMYIRLDPVGPWANHAQGQARRILSGERLRIVSRRGSLVAAG